MEHTLTLAKNNAVTTPYFRDIGILALVSDIWGGLWQPRHQILTRLADYFHVVWCNPAPWWRDYFRFCESKEPLFQYAPDHTKNMAVFSPPRWLPELGRPKIVADWTAKERLRRARQILLNNGCRRTVLYLWRPQYEHALDLIEYDLSCYHIDDEYTFSAIEQPTTDQERRLIERVNQVFIHSPELLNKKGKLNPDTLFVPNGVDYRAYATRHPEPEDLKTIPHPRIGYVGRIKEQLDLSLLVDLAQRHQQWSFVMVGPQDHFERQAPLMQKLSALANVHFLGAKPLGILPAYTQHLDVGMLCYKLDDYTKFIYPLKLHEYLASGRPVIGTPLQSLLDFAHVVKLARTVDEWSEALEKLLSPSAVRVECIQARQNVAKQYDWETLAARVARTLCEQIGPDYLRRFEALA